MIIHTNDKGAKSIKRRRSISVLLNTAVFLMLLFAILLSIVARFAPQIANSPILLIGMGILSTIIGLQSGRILSASTDPHVQLEQGLKGFGNDTILLNYYTPANHLLLSPHGAYLLTAFSQPVDFLADGASIQIRNKLLTRVAWVFMGNTIGRPFIDTAATLQRTEDWLVKHFPELTISKIQPLIVLTNAKAHIEGHEPLIPLLYTDKRSPSLKQTIRRNSSDILSSQSINQLIDALNLSQPTND